MTRYQTSQVALQASQCNDILPASLLQPQTCWDRTNHDAKSQGEAPTTKGINTSSEHATAEGVATARLVCTYLICFLDVCLNAWPKEGLDLFLSLSPHLQCHLLSDSELKDLQLQYHITHSHYGHMLIHSLPICYLKRSHETIKFHAH